MAKSRQRWLYIDERQDDRENYTLLLSATGELEIIAQPPDPTMECLEDWIREDSVDGYLLDYKLSEGDASIHTTGATWATEIRQRLPSRPIVILSGRLRESAMQSALVNRLIPAVDLDLRKGRVTQDYERATKTLLALGDGYARIASQLAAEADVQKALRLILCLEGEESRELVDDVVSWLAVGIGAAGPSRTAGVPIVAKKILGELMTFPGVLLPQSDERRWASSFLGVTPSAFATAAGKSQQYNGVFNAIAPPLYWSHALERLAVDSVATQYCGLCGGNPSIACCANCERPIDGQHSLPGLRLTAELPTNHRVRLCGACLHAGNLREGLALDRRHGARVKTLLRSLGLPTQP